jgi:hypothetical protein
MPMHVCVYPHADNRSNSKSVVISQLDRFWPKLSEEPQAALRPHVPRFYFNLVAKQEGRERANPKLTTS